MKDMKYTTFVETKRSYWTIYIHIVRHNYLADYQIMGYALTMCPGISKLACVKKKVIIINIRSPAGHRFPLTMREVGL